MVTSGVEDLRADHIRCGRSLGLNVVVELQQVATPIRGFDPKPRGLSIQLGANYGPSFRGVERLTLAWATSDLFRRHLPLAQSIGKPTRVRHFVQGVDID